MRLLGPTFVAEAKYLFLATTFVVPEVLKDLDGIFPCSLWSTTRIQTALEG